MAVRAPATQTNITTSDLDLYENRSPKFYESICQKYAAIVLASFTGWLNHTKRATLDI